MYRNLKDFTQQKTTWWQYQKTSYISLNNHRNFSFNLDDNKFYKVSRKYGLFECNECLKDIPAFTTCLDHIDQILEYVTVSSLTKTVFVD